MGISACARSTTEQVTVDTGTGMLMGTLRYISPEQLCGEAATPTWDLWALAVVAYEMLTGTHPFPASSAVELERAIIAGRATPLAAQVPDAPPSWQEFFDHALAREATRRPRSAGDFVSELQCALE